MNFDGHETQKKTLYIYTCNGHLEKRCDIKLKEGEGGWIRNIYPEI